MFIQKILHQDLQKTNEDKILRLMRKIDWDNEELCGLCVQWLAAGWRAKHTGRRCLARLVAGLAPWQDVVGSRVIDAVLEDLRITLEHPHPRHNQRRIAMARYLGELYNYKLVDSRDIFNALYSFITFGVSMDHAVESTLDPPDSAFRIRLVCVLLETCGAYFNSGSSKKKLDYFLIFFQNYYWYKRTDPLWTDEVPFPIYVSNIYHECLSSLRPKLVTFKSWPECKTAVEELKQTLYPFLDKEDAEYEATSEDLQNGLETIVETDDEVTSDHRMTSNSSDEEDNTEAEDIPIIDNMQDTERPPVKEVKMLTLFTEVVRKEKESELSLL
jgi:regulator of nonsense transcripts 2